MRIFLGLSLFLSIGLCQPAFAITAASDMDLAASTQLRLLEMKYFEHTFDSESAEERIERVEKLVRGDIMQGSPADRVKSIVALLQADGESLAPIGAIDTSPKAATTNPSRAPRSQTSRSDDGDRSQTAASNDHGDYPHVTNLEKEILRQSFEGGLLADRLARLETKAFGKPTNTNDFSARIDRLETYAEDVLHDKPFAVNPDIDKTYIIPANVPANRQSYRTARRPDNDSLQDDEKYAVEHFFGSSRRPDLSFSSAPSIADADDNTPHEDPAVYSKTAPPAGSRMITQVGWCEVQTYGHTCPQMHLTQRLRQLADSLLPRQNKLSDMQLMDDLNPIMNAVIAKRAGHQSM